MSLKDIEVGSFASLNWLWLVGLVAAVWLVSVAVDRRAVSRFVSDELRDRFLTTDNSRRRWLAFILLSACMVTLVLCLVDIRWGQVERPVPQKGIEVMFVLDVSRSMLAQDVNPNRLERAKQMIRDTIDEMAGDRVGLVIFAGEVKQSIPITNHYDDFKQRLDEVGPDDIVRGGSDLGDAITVAAEAYLTKTNQHKAMVLLTDGEDMESKPVEAAKKIHQEKGVVIFTIGLGDVSEGSRIPIKTAAGRPSYLQHDGQQVWSKLNGEILAKVASETHGAYIPAATKQVDMAGVYHGYIANIEQQEFETAKVNSFEARFEWFLVPAIGILLVQIFLARES